MKPQHEACLWITGILVVSTVGAHLGRMWRGRSVPSFADYIDFAGIAFILLSITIATGVWRSKRNKPNDIVGNAVRKIGLFAFKVIFLLVVPGTLLAHWLREWLFLGQRAMVYGAFVLVSTAGFVIASRLAASRKYAEIAAAAAAKANGG
jgi:hypothetical protein